MVVRSGDCAECRESPGERPDRCEYCGERYHCRHHCGYYKDNADLCDECEQIPQDIWECPHCPSWRGRNHCRHCCKTDCAVCWEIPGERPGKCEHCGKLWYHCRHRCQYYKDNARLCDECEQIPQDIWKCPHCPSGEANHCRHRCQYYKDNADLCEPCRQIPQDIWKCQCCPLLWRANHCRHRCVADCAECCEIPGERPDLCEHCRKEYHCRHRCEYYKDNAHLCGECGQIPQDIWKCQYTHEGNRRHCLHTCPVVRPKFDTIMLLSLVFGLIMYVFDVGSDIVLAISYFLDGDYVWASLTLSFILIPGMIMSVFSMLTLKTLKDNNRLEDNRKGLEGNNDVSGTEKINNNITPMKDLNIKMTPFAILMISPLWWIVSTLYIYWAWRWRKVGIVNHGIQYMLSVINKYDKYREALSKIQMVEGFMEAAPQLMLQLYIMLSSSSNMWELNVTTVLQQISIVSSLVSISWLMITYYTAIHPDRNVTITSKVVMFLWHICTIGPRVLLLSLFASEYKWGVFIFLIFHFIVMFVYNFIHKVIKSENENDGQEQGQTNLLDRIPLKVRKVIGCVMTSATQIFTFNPKLSFVKKKLKQTWRHYTFYYSLILIENIILSLFWIYYQCNTSSELSAVFSPNNTTTLMVHNTSVGQSISSLPSTTPKMTDIIEATNTSDMLLYSSTAMPGGGQHEEYCNLTYDGRLVVSLCHVVFIIGILLMLLYYYTLQPRVQEGWFRYTCREACAILVFASCLPCGLVYDRCHKLYTGKKGIEFDV